MPQDTPKYNSRFEAQAQGFAVGDGNIIYNYFGYETEVASTGAPVDDLPCPYRGLYHFTPSDAEYFFGREDFVEELFQATQTRNFIPVLGASGSGKSSVVLAGLLPKLEQEQKDHWLFTHFRPSEGDDPFHALALALVPLYAPKLFGDAKFKETHNIAESLRDRVYPLSYILTGIKHGYSNKKLLLIADQFEEIYTHCANNEIRSRFLDCLLSSLQSPDSEVSSSTVLVTTMRADFLANALSYRPFADMLQKDDIKLGAMSREELTVAIKKPAEQLGVTFEAGLVTRILNDVEREPGNLSLLEFALTELWKKRTDKLLTHHIYEAIGQVKGALADYASNKYENLTEKEKEHAQCIFIQLIHPNEGTEDTRRLSTRDEVGEDNWNLVIKLASFRLVVTNRIEDTGKETVEIVNEALIQEWKTLQDWIERNREFRIWQEGLKTRIKECNDGKGELLSKVRLRIAKEWLKTHGQQISKEEKNFIKKSQQQRRRQWWLVRSITAIILLGSSFALAELYKRSCDVGEKIGQDCFRFIITSGDSRLFVGTTNQYIDKGIKHFAQGEFEEAENYFKKARDTAPHNPIHLIYENNAKALARGNPYKLAVVVPVDNHEEISQNMLRGVAFAQKEFNQKRENSYTPLLQIIIANDKNDQKITKKVAESLIKEDVLGIIGHRSSGSSLTAIPVYDKKGISMVSPTSGSANLDHQDKENDVFFRAVASNKKIAERFYEYVKQNCLDKNEDNQVWLVHDSKAEYSKNLKENFDNSLESEYKERFDQYNFNYFSDKSEEQIKQEIIKEKIEDKGVKCAILLPSTKTTAAAISIFHAHNKLNLPNDRKILFLSGSALHNDETLKVDEASEKERLMVLLPQNQIDENKKKLIDDEWRKNISWRTYTSYQATKFLIRGLEKLDNKNERSINKKREIVLNYLKRHRNSLEDNLDYCLISLKDVEQISASQWCN